MSRYTHTKFRDTGTLYDRNMIATGTEHIHYGHIGKVTTLSIGIISFMGPIHPVNVKAISERVLLLLNGNQVQDGYHGGRIFFDGPNAPCEFQIDQSERSPVIERKPMRDDDDDGKQ